MDKDTIVIVSATRTPIGNFQGALKEAAATDLGATAIKGAVAKAHLEPHDIDAVIMGCVLPAGLGQAPARQAALKAGLPVAVDCTTVNKMCASGMKAVMLAHDLLRVKVNDIIVAGGMESMTNAPYLLPKARAGYRLGHQVVIDHMFFDGLEDAYEKGNLMGVFAEKCAKQFHFTREAQDDFALKSLQKARKAMEKGVVAQEITPVTVKSPKGDYIVVEDEGPLAAKPEKIPQLKPAFAKDGTVTAANSSSISDGAAALVLMRYETAQALALRPLAKIIAHATYSQASSEFTTAPIHAINKLLPKINWSVDDVDAWEINEAFAVVVMAAIHELNLPPEKVNIHGGATVLGHPIGASGARLIVTLLNTLEETHSKRGVAALCIGGGEATAIAIERVTETK